MVLAWDSDSVLTQAKDINALQFFGGVVQEKKSNIGFCGIWAFPTLGMTVLCLGSAQHGHPEGWKRPSTTETHIKFLYSLVIIRRNFFFF